AWNQACSRLEEVGIDSLPAPGLSLLGRAAWWAGRMDLSLTAWQQAYKAWVEEDNPELAAEACLEIAEAFFHRIQPAIGNTWFRRAETLLAGRPDSHPQAWLHRMKAQSTATSEDAFELTSKALAIAEGLGDRDLAAICRHDRGRLRVKMGEVADGMAEMEEVMAEVLSGSIGPAATGRIYCNMLDTCEQLADYRRAAEWDEAARSWCEHVTELSAYPGICRVKRAQIKRVRGSLQEAEDEARRAIGDLAEFLDFGAQAWIEIGEIRLRRGDWEGAMESFGRARSSGADPQPGLAMVEFEFGRTGEARAMLEMALSTRSEPLDRVRLLPALAEVTYAIPDLQALKAVSDELRVLATRFPSTALAASSATADGLFALAAGDSDTAIRSLQSAIRLWSETRAPFEGGRAHLHLASAYDQSSKPGLAELERTAASGLFTQMGAIQPGQHRIAGGEVALLHTDIVRSTDLIAAIGDEAWTHLLRWHDQTLRSLFNTFGGVERGHAGDGFLVAFSNPQSGLECAVATQQRLSQQRREQGFAPEVRIGLHYGSVELVGGTLTGNVVHACARIGALAEPNEILASGALMAAVPSSRYGPGREVDLRGLPDPMKVAPVAWAT
ncbi:MAG: adenylate/guanylate cyclase domain-containing protein, partial [Acidimicrobiia bacterium]|nr:adenylate/guanylate cyclase domain-containing protein [Acidimicrobiia bacterium]